MNFSVGVYSWYTIALQNKTSVCNPWNWRENSEYQGIQRKLKAFQQCRFNVGSDGLAQTHYSKWYYVVLAYLLRQPGQRRSREYYVVCTDVDVVAASHNPEIHSPQIRSDCQETTCRCSLRQWLASGSQNKPWKSPDHSCSKVTPASTRRWPEVGLISNQP